MVAWIDSGAVSDMTLTGPEWDSGIEGRFSLGLGRRPGIGKYRFQAESWNGIGVGFVDAGRERLLIAGVGLAVLAIALAIFAFAVPRGFGLTDEALTIYLLLHPDTPMASMDHFVLGHVLSHLPWNVIGLRWLAVTLSLATAVILALSTLHWLRKSFDVLASPGGILLVVFSLIGGLLCFTAVRPLPNYAFNLVIACDLFAIIYFFTRGRSWASAISMGLLAGMVFLARAPAAPFLLLFLFAAAWAEGRAIFDLDNLWHAARIACVGALFVAVMAAAGLNVSLQFELMRVLATASHEPSQVIMRDLRYGLMLLAIAAATGGGISLLLPGSAEGYRNDRVLMAAALIGAGAATGYMLWSGFASFSPIMSTLPAGNDAPRSLGPAIHVVVMSLLFVYALRGRNGRPLLKPCLLLYFLCLLPQIGTNTGIWHRTTANMAPLFLVIGLVLVEGVRQSVITRRALASVTFAIAPPVLLALFASLVTHPMAIQGGANAQTVRLSHPQVLSGIKVTPQMAELQARLDRQLAQIRFDRSRERLLPGDSRLGLAVLAGARALGNGWYFSGYAGSEKWNCAVTQLWLPHAPARVIAIDASSLRATAGHCLADYVLPAKSDGLGEVSVLSRR